MRTKPKAALLLVLGAATLSACTQPSGPLLGEWRGQAPGGSVYAPKSVDVTLSGPPGATAGTYYFTSQENDPTLLAQDGKRQWGGNWVKADRVVNGQAVSTITLQRLLSGEIDVYALEPNGTLRPVDRDGLPDTTPAGSLYVLSPVKPHRPLL